MDGSEPRARDGDVVLHPLGVRDFLCDTAGGAGGGPRRPRHNVSVLLQSSIPADLSDLSDRDRAGISSVSTRVAHGAAGGCANVGGELADVAGCRGIQARRVGGDISGHPGALVAVIRVVVLHDVLADLALGVAARSLAKFAGVRAIGDGVRDSATLAQSALLVYRVLLRVV